jgi:hypothetical protein
MNIFYQSVWDSRDHILELRFFKIYVFRVGHWSYDNGSENGLILHERHLYHDEKEFNKISGSFKTVIII